MAHTVLGGLDKSLLMALKYCILVQPVESHPRTASARAVRRPKRWEEETVPERRPRTRTSRDAHTPSVAPYPPLAQKFNVYSLYLAVDPSAPAQ